MPNYEWMLIKNSGFPSPSAQSIENSYGGGTMDSDITILARETIQNAVDACSSPGGSTEVIFRKKTLSGDSLEAFRKLMIFNPEDRTSMEQYFRTRDDKASLDFYDKLANGQLEKVNVLIIEDYGTTGLTGPDDNWMENAEEGGGYVDQYETDWKYLRLIIGHGIESDPESGTGGSFGYGKDAYMRLTNNAQTLFYYSTFKKDEKLNQTPATARLVGRIHARIKARPKPGVHATKSGLGFWGVKKQRSGDGLGFIAPFEDEEAHSLAEQLGFERRDKGPGTSIMIVDLQENFSDEDGPDNHFDQLCLAVENHWWPRLTDNGLDVAIHKNNKNAEVMHPDKSKPSLQYFAQLYSYITGVSNPPKDSETIQIKRPIGPIKKNPDIRLYFRKKDLQEDSELRAAIENRWKNTDIGSLALLRFESHGIEGSDDSLESSFITSSKIALIRSPGMVIGYFDIPNGDKMDGYRFAGIFKASKQSNPIFQNAEPPPHHQWETERTKLRNEYEDGWLKHVWGRKTSTGRLNTDGYLWDSYIGEFLRRFESEPDYENTTHGNAVVRDLLGPWRGPMRTMPPGFGNHRDKHSIRTLGKSRKNVNGQSMNILYLQKEISLKATETEPLMGKVTLKAYLTVDDTSKLANAGELIESLYINGKQYPLNQLQSQEFTLSVGNGPLNKLITEVWTVPLPVEYRVNIDIGFSPNRPKQTQSEVVIE